MEGGDLLAQRQPQPRAALGAGAGLVHHIEGLRNFAQLLLRDAPALVAHLEPVAGIQDRAGQGDRAAGLRGLPGVVQQILHQGLQQGAVARQHALLRRHRQGQSLGLHGRLADLLRPLAQPEHVDRSGVRLAVAHHQQAHQAQGQVLQPLALGEDVVGGLEGGVAVHPAAAEHVRVADDGGEGRFQLVDKAGGEILLPPGGVLQLLHVFLNGVRHMVEVGGQLAELVPAGHRRPGGVVASGQLGGDPAQGADGPGEQVGEEKQHRAAHRRHDQQYPAVDLKVDQHLAGLAGADHVAGGAAVNTVQQLLVAAGGEVGVDLGPLTGADPELPVSEIGLLGEGPPEAPAPLADVLQGDASGIAHGLVGDAQHLHLLQSQVDLPVQGGAEGQGDDQVAAHAHGEDQDADGGQGDLPGKLHGSLTSSR